MDVGELKYKLNLQIFKLSDQIIQMLNFQFFLEMCLNCQIDVVQQFMTKSRRMFENYHTSQIDRRTVTFFFNPNPCNQKRYCMHIAYVPIQNKGKTKKNDQIMTEKHSSSR